MIVINCFWMRKIVKEIQFLYPRIGILNIYIPFKCCTLQPIFYMQAKIFNTNKRICISELPHSKLAKHIEDRVHNFMQEQKEKGDLHIGEITIRVLGSFDKRVDVRPNLKERYVALFCNCPLQSLDILSRDYIISILEPKILVLRNIKS